MGKDNEMKSMFEAVSNLTTLFTELKETINSLKTENNALTEKFNKFAAEPSAETITKKSSHFSKTAEKQDKLKFFAK
jgi:chloramphenicol O-acetyltransferase